MEQRGWSKEDLARRMGCSVDQVRRLLCGQSAVDAQVAQQLSRALGGSAAFWLRKQAAFDSRSSA
jgi:HTH-type transcriptional regulator/antitoxin HigA